MSFLKNVGPVELLVLLLILVVVFGVGRISELGGALGKSIRDFKNEIRGPEEDTATEEAEEEKLDESSERLTS